MMWTRQLVDGYQVSQAIHVVATLGVADLLVDGPRTSEELATETGTHPPSLYRLLRALASVGVFGELVGGRFELTPLGRFLRLDVADSIARLGRSHWAAVLLGDVVRAPPLRPHRRHRLPPRPRHRRVDVSLDAP